MKSTHHTRFAWSYSLIALTVVCATGCLESETSEYATYDARTDTFHYLVIYSHISGQNARDYEWLAQRYSARDTAVPIPVTNMVPLGGIVLQRTIPGAYSKTALAEKPERFDTIDANALDSVVIRPGEFFVGKDGSLCYYHEMEAPGKVLDQLLELCAKSLGDGIIEGCRSELLRRKSGHQLSWDDVRMVLLGIADTTTTERVSSLVKHVQGRSCQPALLCLDESSLKKLLQQVTTGTFRIRRTGSKFAVTLALSPGDTKQTVATLGIMNRKLRDAVLEATQERLGTNLPQEKYLDALEAKNGPWIRGLATALLSFEVSDKGEQGLQVTVDIGTRIGCRTEQPVVPADSPHSTVLHEATLAAIEGRGIVVNKRITFDGILKRFSDRR